MRSKIILALAGFIAFVVADDTCKQAAGKQISGLAVRSPDTTTGATIGQPFTITWDATSGYSTVSILLLKGPSTNVIPHGCIADSVPNSGHYSWTPSSSIGPVTGGNSGFGIQIIADGSGDFQYSSQFGISGGSSSSGSGNVITSTTVISGSKVTETLYHTPIVSSSSSSSHVYPSHKIVHSHNHTAHHTAYSTKKAAPSTSAGNVTESVSPTVSMSVPASLANVGGSGHEITGSPSAGTPAASSAAPVTTASKAAAPKMVVGGALAGLGALAALAL